MSFSFMPDVKRMLRPEEVEHLQKVSQEAFCLNFRTDREERNARRRYYYLIRKLSGYKYVTHHYVEHPSEFRPHIYSVLFGRAGK